MSLRGSAATEAISAPDRGDCFASLAVTDINLFTGELSRATHTTDNENDWPGSASVSLALGATRMVALPGLFAGEIGR